MKGRELIGESGHKLNDVIKMDYRDIGSERGTGYN
jgi:hypothetical protein